MPSDTQVANLALAHLGVSKPIGNLQTEKSQEALACREFFEPALKATLRATQWPFATSFAALSLVESAPTTEWGYSYQYPQNCACIRRVLSGTRNDTRQTRVPFIVVRAASGKLIYCDRQDAEVEFTYMETDPNKWTEDFMLAFSHRLAAYIAPRVTGGDPFKMGERAMRMYMFESSIAVATGFNEQQDEEKPDSEFVNSRG